MTALVEYEEMITIFGRTDRIRETIKIKKCGKNRRNEMAKKEAEKKKPNLTFNRVVSFDLC